MKIRQLWIFEGRKKRRTGETRIIELVSKFQRGGGLVKGVENRTNTTDNLRIRNTKFTTGVGFERFPCYSPMYTFVLYEQIRRLGSGQCECNVYNSHCNRIRSVIINCTICIYFVFLYKCPYFFFLNTHDFPSPVVVTFRLFTRYSYKFIRRSANARD